MNEVEIYVAITLINFNVTLFSVSLAGLVKTEGFFKVFRFLGFNVYAQSHAEHWTQEYVQLNSYRGLHVD